MPPLFMSASPLPQRLARYLALGALVPAALLACKHLLAATCTLALLLLAGALRWFLSGAFSPAPEPVQTTPTAALEAPTHQDGLTGIASRTALDARLAEEWKRERRVGEPTALLLIAVDAFSTLEDEGSPLASDVALLTLARALTRQLPRRADLLARYDRPAFAVLLPGTDLPGTLRVAARLRWAILRLGLAHPRAASGILTASLGVAVQHGLIGDGAQALFAAAEGALRTAQAGGPDRLEYVVLHGEDRPGCSVPPVLALPAMRPWTPDRDAPHPTQS